MTNKIILSVLIWATNLSEFAAKVQSELDKLNKKGYEVLSVETKKSDDFNTAFIRFSKIE